MKNGKPTVLIVDDHPFNLDLLEQELIDDYEVVRAQDGAGALRAADACDPDLILLDVRMPPGMNGLEVLKHLRASERHVTTPVILLTAQASLGDKVEGLSAGADDYITKPFVSEDLHARIRRALRIGHLQKEPGRERNELSVISASHPIR